MKKVEVGKDAAIEAEVKAARERAVVPVEIRMQPPLASQGMSNVQFFFFDLHCQSPAPSSRHCS